MIRGTDVFECVASPRVGGRLEADKYHIFYNTILTIVSLFQWRVLGSARGEFHREIWISGTPEKKKCAEGGSRRRQGDYAERRAKEKEDQGEDCTGRRWLFVISCKWPRLYGRSTGSGVITGQRGNGG